MCWFLKIFFFTNFLLHKEPATDIYTYHINFCHFLWAEDFSFQLELKPNQTFYFSRGYRIQGQHIQKHITTLYPEIFRRAMTLSF